jgi:hypothetical protein
MGVHDDRDARPIETATASGDRDRGDRRDVERPDRDRRGGDASGPSPSMYASTQTALFVVPDPAPLRGAAGDAAETAASRRPTRH